MTLWWAPLVSAQPATLLTDRVEGLLIGPLIGDAVGGPHEFQTPVRSVWTTEDHVLTEAGRTELAASFRLIPYGISASPYGPWVDQAPVGTLTDDSRWKVILFESLERAGTVDRIEFARSILSSYADTAGPYGDFPHTWLHEYSASARWVLGQSVSDGALPLERVWGGIPTMAGQMPFLPIAGLHPGDPKAAYLSVWSLNFIDNSYALDINSAVVAGLAAALDSGATWMSVEDAMRSTDPYGYAEVPWVPRKLNHWLDVAHEVVQQSDGQASRLYDILEDKLNAVTWWEAHVPVVIVFACAEFADFDPLATMQLVLEFGHDTDSYLQLAGAFFGALHGKDVFPKGMREVVEARLEEDYNASIEDWMLLLGYDRQ